MPGLAQRNDQFSNGSSAAYSLSSNGFWSKNRDDVSYNQLQKVMDFIILLISDGACILFVDFDGTEPLFLY